MYQMMYKYKKGELDNQNTLTNLLYKYNQRRRLFWSINYAICVVNYSQIYKKTTFNQHGILKFA